MDLSANRFYFRFSFFVFLCSKENEIGLLFSFFIFPLPEENGIRIHLMLSVFFFCRSKKRNFRMDFENDYDSVLVFCFLVYGIKN